MSRESSGALVAWHDESATTWGPSLADKHTVRLSTAAAATRMLSGAATDDRPSRPDLAPVCRQLVIESRGFSDRFSLTGFHVLRWGRVPEGAVRPLVVVVTSPGFDLCLRVSQRQELMHVQALVAQATVERYRRSP